MRGCLTAQSERLTRASLTIGQDSRVVAIKARGEEGRDTGLVDRQLEGGREGERGGEREGKGGDGEGEREKRGEGERGLMRN